MADRFFVDSPVVAPVVTLAGAEAHHLLNVLRATPGQELVLFDGTGCEYAGRVHRLRRAEVDVTIESKQRVDRELPFSLTLVVALPKGDRQRWLVEKSVELGVTRLIPIETRRSIAQPATGALDRLRRSVIEASKQCGRNVLMAIDPPESWPAAIGAAPANARRWIAHPPHAMIDRAHPLADLALSPTDTWLAIGPEGGWIDEELALAVAAGWTTVHLGPRILRVETAATTLAAIVVALTIPLVINS